MIPYNMPIFVPGMLENMRQACEVNRKVSGDGPFTKKASKWLEELTGAPKVLLTTSCSHALDMMAVLCGIGPGDEVIIPSYNFPSAANAFVLRGATCVFVDIRPDTMNIDAEHFDEHAIVPDQGDLRNSLRRRRHLRDGRDQASRSSQPFLLEDAAQGMLSAAGNGRRWEPWATWGPGFLETKNFSMGEGGCLATTDAGVRLPAEMLREKARTGAGSSAAGGQVQLARPWARELSAARDQRGLASALATDIAHKITAGAFKYGARTTAGFFDLQAKAVWKLPASPAQARSNGHIFIKCRDIQERTKFIAHMKQGR